MTSRSDILTQSLIDYINDVKPYHTKFRDITSQLYFSDSFNVSASESHLLTLDFQNIWTRDDLGGYLLTNISEGATVDKTYVLPATIFPRFSLNDKLQYNQQPPGNDPATQDFSDPDLSGVPDSEISWTGIPPNQPFTPSHQHGSDQIPVSVGIFSINQVINSQGLVGGLWQVDSTVTIVFDSSGETEFGFDPASITITANHGVFNSFTVTGNTIVASYTEVFASQTAYNDFNIFNSLIGYNAGPGQPGFGATSPGSIQGNLSAVQVIYNVTGRFAVPYHQGSRVRVNQIFQPFGFNYIVNDTRSFIQFLPGFHPNLNDNVDINLFKSDKLFIAWQDPFNSVNIQAGSFVVGHQYMILFSGNTSWLSIGAITNDPFTIFTATGSGSGTGIALDISLSDNFVVTFDGTNNLITFNNTQPGTHKAALKNLTTFGANVGDTWTITAIGPWNFIIQKTTPLQPNFNNCYFKTPYTDGVISFTLDVEWKQYYVTTNPNVEFYSYYIEQDVNSYISYDEEVLGTSDHQDPSEFFPNLDIVTQHGSPVDIFPPLAAPVHFRPFGVVRREIDGDYIFEFDSIPPVNTYIEFRVEQQDQYNQLASMPINDEAILYCLQNGIVTSIQILGSYVGT